MFFAVCLSDAARPSSYKTCLHECPHFWIDRAGRLSRCSAKYRDGSALIRHRSRKHGFETGDDQSKVSCPTPVGMRFPMSKYAVKKPHKEEFKGDSIHPALVGDFKPLSQASVDLKTLEGNFSAVPIAGTSSAPYLVHPPTARRSSRMKPLKQTVVKKEEQDDSIALTAGVAPPLSYPHPAEAAEWNMSSSSSGGQVKKEEDNDVCLDDPALSAFTDFYPVHPDTLLSGHAVCRNFAQVGSETDLWTIDSQVPAADFGLLSATHQTLPFNGTVNPNALALPTPCPTTTFKQVEMLSAGMGLAPVHHDGVTANTLLWGQSMSPAPSALRESILSPDNMFCADSSQWMSSANSGMHGNFCL